MKKRNKRVLFYIITLLSLTAIITSCNLNRSINIDTTVDIQTETNKKDEIEDVVPLLQKQYQEYLEKINNGIASDYDYVMASDRANGLKAFGMGPTDNMQVLKNEEIKAHLQNSPIFNGYTSKGLHIQAIVQPVNISVSEQYEEAIRIIREDNLEIELFETLESFSYRSETEYFAIDIFVDSLVKDNQKYHVDVTILDRNSNKYSPLIMPYNEGELDYLATEFGRSMPFEKELNDNEWRLFIFNTAIELPRIFVDIDGEEVEMIH